MATEQITTPSKKAKNVKPKSIFKIGDEVYYCAVEYNVDDVKNTAMGNFYRLTGRLGWVPETLLSTTKQN